MHKKTIFLNTVMLPELWEGKCRYNPRFFARPWYVICIKFEWVFFLYLFSTSEFSCSMRLTNLTNTLYSGELFVHSGSFLLPLFKDMSDSVLKFREHRDKLVKKTVVVILPKIIGIVDTYIFNTILVYLMGLSS